jgi:hypothetical protein
MPKNGFVPLFSRPCMAKCLDGAYEMVKRFTLCRKGNIQLWQYI